MKGSSAGKGTPALANTAAGCFVNGPVGLSLVAATWTTGPPKGGFPRVATAL